MLKMLFIPIVIRPLPGVCRKADMSLYSFAPRRFVPSFSLEHKGVELNPTKNEQSSVCAE